MCYLNKTRNSNNLILFGVFLFFIKENVLHVDPNWNNIIYECKSFQINQCNKLLKT